METDQILDLFSLGDTTTTSMAPGALSDPTNNNNNDGSGGGSGGNIEASAMVDVETGQVKEKGKKGYLDEIGELWDTGGYEEEFDLGGFLKTMKM